MRLLFYVVRRLLMLIPVLVGVSMLTFIAARMLPGNPALLVAGPLATDEDIARMEADMQLDRPIWEQYYNYLRDLSRGDLGRSWRTGMPVATELLRRFPATFELTTTAMFFAVLFGIPLGAMAAIKQGTRFDHIIRVLSVGGVSIPVFWSGLILIFVFYYLLGWAPAPVGRMGLSVAAPTRVSGFYLLDSVITGNWHALRSVISQMALPVMTLVFAMLPSIIRVTRSSMLDVCREDYVRTALATGLRRRTVIFQDALRNALLPVVTTIGGYYGYSLGDEVLVEQIFSWPGMGRYSIDAIYNLDYAAVQAFVMIVAIIYITVYLAVDLLYAVLDPRVRY